MKLFWVRSKRKNWKKPENSKRKTVGRNHRTKRYFAHAGIANAIHFHVTADDITSSAIQNAIAIYSSVVTIIRVRGFYWSSIYKGKWKVRAWVLMMWDRNFIRAIYWVVKRQSPSKCSLNHLSYSFCLMIEKGGG